MKHIIVASANPVKIQAALEGFQRMFPGQSFQAEGRPASSGVSVQPATDQETFQGALNRARAVAGLHPQADFWAGIEGGNQDCLFPECPGEIMTFAWVVILSRGMRGALKMGKGRSGTFFLPQAVTRLVRQGLELGEADDRVFGRSNSKQENGAVGLLTGDVIDRAGLYGHAVTLALIPFRNPELYETPE